jgi:HPt (histidine-containing phosphotransfer) domain-containing protein
MALHYNLAKVYALSDNDPEFVLQIVTLFVNEIPEDLSEIKEGIKKKDHKHAYSYAHKVKSKLGLRPKAKPKKSKKPLRVSSIR